MKRMIPNPLFMRSLSLYSPQLPALQTQSRSIVRLVKKDNTLGSFDSRDAPLEPVNPYNLPTSANNAAGEDY